MILLQPTPSRKHRLELSSRQFDGSWNCDESIATVLWVQSRLNVFVLAGNLRQLSLAAVRRAVSVCMLHRVANHGTE